MKVLQYGMKIGKLASIERYLLCSTFLKPRLCDSSWIARKSEWLAVAPTTYTAARYAGQDHSSVSHAMPTCSSTVAATQYFVRGSGPISSLISGCFFRISIFRDACGSGWSRKRKSDRLVACSPFISALRAPFPLPLPIAAARSWRLVTRFLRVEIQFRTRLTIIEPPGGPVRPTVLNFFSQPETRTRDSLIRTRVPPSPAGGCGSADGTGPAFEQECRPIG